jgi:hypothetical protein
MVAAGQGGLALDQALRDSEAGEIGAAAVPVPLEYSIERLICAFASRWDVVLVSLPGAAQDRLRAHVPGTRPGRPGVPQ